MYPARRDFFLPFGAETVFPCEPTASTVGPLCCAAGRRGRPPRSFYPTQANSRNLKLLLRPLQLRVLLHQLLQTEARELYRDLGLFPISFPLIDSTLAVFGVAYFLAGPESLLAFRLFDREFGQVELLAPRGEELGDVVDGVVSLGRSLRLLPSRLGPMCALVFVLVVVMRVQSFGASPRRTGEGGRPHSFSSGSQFFDQVGGDFLQEARWGAGLGEIGSVAAAVDGAGQDERIHGAGHSDVAKAALFLDVVRLKEGARMGKQAFFQPSEKHQRKLQALGGVQGHERDLGAHVVSVGV